MTYIRLVTSLSDCAVHVSGLLTINTSTITISRLSDQGSSLLISRMVVSPVSNGLNGTVVKCFEGGSSSTEPVATTTIYIIGGEY